MNDQILTGVNARLSRFKEEWRIVDHAGPFRLIATGVNTEWVNPHLLASEKASDYEHSILVNFKAVERRKAPAVKQAFINHGKMVDKNGEVTELTTEAEDILLDLAYLRGLTLVYELTLNRGEEAPPLPVRGQEVIVSVEEAGALDRNGEAILQVTDMQVPEVRRGRSFSGLSVEDLKQGQKQEQKDPSLEVPAVPAGLVRKLRPNSHS